MKYFSVYVEKTNGIYTYCSDDELVKIGDRVLVSFRKKDKIGLVLAEETDKTYEFEVLKIKKLLHDEISFSKNFIDLLIWIKDYYISSFEQIFLTSVPSGIKIKYEDFYRPKNLKKLLIKDDIFLYFESKGKVRKKTLYDKFSKYKIEQLVENKNLEIIDGWYSLIDEKNCDEDVLEYFKEKEKVSKATIEKTFDKKLIEKHLKTGELIYERKIKDFNSENLKKISEKKVIKSCNNLNENQEKIRSEIENSSKRHFLIRGVTGSGKTEIYIELIKNALKKGNGSIFLVPEISLTPQMVKRFEMEFQGDVAILHSRLSNSDRAKEWYSIYTGDKKVVLGVRSAIFAPVKNLEYIIVDEEHENSYKQDTLKMRKHWRLG